MKGYDLLAALGEIDDEYIARGLEYTPVKKIHRIPQRLAVAGIIIMLTFLCTQLCSSSYTLSDNYAVSFEMPEYRKLMYNNKQYVRADILQAKLPKGFWSDCETGEIVYYNESDTGIIFIREKGNLGWFYRGYVATELINNSFIMYQNKLYVKLGSRITIENKKIYEHYWIFENMNNTSDNENIYVGTSRYSNIFRMPENELECMSVSDDNQYYKKVFFNKNIDIIFLESYINTRYDDVKAYSVYVPMLIEYGKEFTK